MFIVQCSNGKSLQQALFILSCYDVVFYTESDGENADSTYIVVDDEGRDGDMRLAEMAFQMSFNQAKCQVCPACEDATQCGHLMFTNIIEPAF